MKVEYRIIVGEVGNVQGHIVPTQARTMAGASRALLRALAPYHGDGWGRIEARLSGQDDTCWQEVR